MKVSLKKLPQAQIELYFEIPAKEFEKFVEKATLELGKDLEVEGFRKGKVPREIIERKIPQKDILERAAELTIEELYPKAILEKKIEVISPPQISILKLAKGNDFEFKAITQILPEIELPDYKKIASEVKKREVKVTKEEIEKLRQEKERIERERVRAEILDKIAQNTKAEIPELLIVKEKQRMLENLKRGVKDILKIPFEEYLKKLQKTEKEILDSFQKEAEKRILQSLLLREIGKKEKIEISEKEIEEEMKKMLIANPNLEKELDSGRLREYTKEVLRNEKILAKLESFVVPND